MTGKPSATTLRIRTADGLQLAADVSGPERGPGVVLAHGGGQTRHAWAGAARALAGAGYRVVSYDARGHGESDWAGDHAYPLHQRWSDMSLVCAWLGNPVAIVGASMGGGAALQGLLEGYRPAALVLVDIAPNADRDGMARVQAFMRAGIEGYDSLNAAADAVAAYLPDRPRPEDVSGLMKNLRLGEDERWYWHWDPGLVLTDLDEERAAMQATMTALADARKVPLLLVRGLRSDVVTSETVEAFRRAVPDLNVFEIAAAGHMVAGDRNDLFNEAVIGFLKQHWPVRR